MEHPQPPKPLSGGKISSKDEAQSQAPELASEASDKEIQTAIEEAQKYWTCTPDGNIFWGTSNIEAKIPPGLYKSIYQERIGYCFQKVIVATDTLIPLPETISEEVIQQIEVFRTPEMRKKLEDRGFLYKRGILMVGEPASGKTSIIQRLMKTHIDAGGVAVYGEDPQILTGCLQMLRRIEANRPIIVVLEDFETLAERGERENQWLALLDGESQIDNVVFLATTNYIEKLDKRFRDRPSRFDTIIAVPMPTAKSRAYYLMVKEPSLTVEELVEWVNLSDGFSIAHLKEMIIGVKCYGKKVEDVVAHMNFMRKRELSSSDMEKQSKTKRGIGFGEDSQSEVFTEEDAETLIEQMKAEGWNV